MAMSGVELDDKSLEAFLEMKQKHTLRCIIYEFSKDHKNIVVKETFEKKDETESTTQAAVYESIMGSLKDETQAYYIVFDLAVDSLSSEEPGQSHTTKKDVMVLMSKCFDACPVKMKMLCASSKQSVQKKMVGIKCVIEANDAESATYENVLKCATQKK